MNHSFLNQLLSEPFRAEVGFLLPPAALRRRLQRLSLVRDVHLAVRVGIVRCEHVRAFVTEATRDFRAGELLPNEAALAALAVALETCPQDFAEQYLLDLAKLKLAEVATAARVSRECLRARYSRPKTQTLQRAFPVPPDRVRVERVTTRRGTRRTGYEASKVVRFDAAGSC